MAAAPTVTFTSVAEVCTHLRNGARRLLRKVPELELAAQNGHCAMFASMIKDKELGGDAYLIRTCGQALVGLPELEMTVPSVYMNAANQIFADLMAYALDELAAGRTRAELDKFRVGRQVAAARFGFAWSSAGRSCATGAGLGRPDAPKAPPARPRWGPKAPLKALAGSLAARRSRSRSPRFASSHASSTSRHRRKSDRAPSWSLSAMRARPPR